MDLGTRKRLFNRCDPREPLAPDDPRNVHVLDPSVRGRPPVEASALSIEAARRPVTAFFTGQPGAGVTTELRRLSARLADPTRANLLVVDIDGAEVIDLHSPIDTPDLLLAVLEHTAAAVAGAEGAPRAALRRFSRWLPEASTGDGPSVSARLRVDASARAAFRARVAGDLSHFVAEVRSELILLEARARDHGRAGLVVIFDALDRLRGTSATWREVITSAARVLDRDASLIELPIHAVYTLPSALALDLRAPVSFVSPIALFDRSGARSDAGFAAGREIVARRLPDADRDALFGAEAEAWIDRLLAQSGGSPGAIVRLLRDVIAERSLDAQLFDRVLSMAGDELRRAVPADAYPWLARVHLDKDLPIEGDPQRDLAAQMITGGAVIRYETDRAWFDLHPAVRTLPGVDEAIGELRARP